MAHYLHKGLLKDYIAGLQAGRLIARLPGRGAQAAAIGARPGIKR